MDDEAETDLAWDLVELVSLHISERNRTDVYTAIGAGDWCAAIGTLLETIVQASIPVPFALAARVKRLAPPIRASCRRTPTARITHYRKVIGRQDRRQLTPPTPTARTSNVPPVIRVGRCLIVVRTSAFRRRRMTSASDEIATGTTHGAGGAAPEIVPPVTQARSP